MASKTVTTTATASRASKPEQATIDVLVLGRGDSAADARTAARDRGSLIRETIAVADDRVETREFQVTDAEASFEPEIDARFQATEQFRIRTQPSNVATLITEITDAGGSIETLQYQLTVETRTSLEDEVLAAAMKRARQKADSLAAAEALSVGGVVEIETKTVTTGHHATVETAWESAPNLHPAPITVAETVEVMYELTT